MGDAGICAALLLGHFRMHLGEALDVRLIDYGLVIRNPQELVTVPVEERVDDHAQHHVRRRVLVVA